MTTSSAILAAVVSTLAFRLKLLTAGGAVAATLVGALAIPAGNDWVLLLLGFFASSSALTRWRRNERDRIIGDLVEKGDRRDAVQVLANGAVFAVAAFGATRGDAEVWHTIGAGAIAAATADTWSTEVGTVAGGIPRHILSGREVAPGTSGGVTVAGSVAAVAGAVLAATLPVLIGWDVPFGAIVAGGVGGSLLDSLLGATMQERRWCTQCDAATERRIHRCGATTVRRGGVPSFNNDLVNLTSILAGAAITWVFA